LPIGPELSYLEAHHHSGAEALEWIGLDPAQFTGAGVEQPEHGAQVGGNAAPNLGPSRRGVSMASVQEIRQLLRGQRIETLRSSIEPLLAGKAGAEVWLFGSLARGDWDARSDVDLLAVAPDQSAADQLAEALLAAGLADDVIGLSQGRWLERQRGDDPWWRGICRDAIRLQPTLKP